MRELLFVSGTACFLLVLALGCASSGPKDVPPDELFGHRFDGEAPDGRRTITITPPDTQQAYFYYPAVVDTVHIRPARYGPNSPERREEVPVELLVKGAFPDACTELDRVEQEHAGNLLNVTLQMRKPQGMVCASVLRPYRFYMLLDGAYGPGSYTLKMNGGIYPFVIRAPDTDLN